MWLLLFPSCRSSQLITVIHISFSLSLCLFCHIRLLISAVWDFFFFFFLFFLFYAYIHTLSVQYSSIFFIYGWIHSATYREAVLICALLSLMKALWTDDGVSSSCADSVRSRSCGLQVCPCCLDDGVNTFYDKLERENTAGSDGSGMRQPVESVHSFWSEIDENMLPKR